MDRISGLNHIIEALRRQLDPSTRKTRTTEGRKEQKQSSATPVSTSLSLDQLEQRIIDRVKSVGSDDQDPRHQPGYVLVESILAWEFGENALGHPEFSEIVDKVSQTIQADPSLNKKISRLLADMINK
jgi:hypothetical protein